MICKIFLLFWLYSKKISTKGHRNNCLVSFSIFKITVSLISVMSAPATCARRITLLLNTTVFRRQMYFFWFSAFSTKKYERWWNLPQTVNHLIDIIATFQQKDCAPIKFHLQPKLLSFLHPEIIRVTARVFLWVKSNLDGLIVHKIFDVRLS